MKVLKSLSLLALALNLASCGKQHLSENELQIMNSSIVGGQKVEATNYQSVVALADNEGKIYCTGNLISPTQIITASHCIMSTQVPQHIAMQFLVDIETRVNLIINNRIADNTYSVEDMPEVLSNVAIMKNYIKKAIREHMDSKAKEIAIHVGTGTMGRKAVDVKKDLIAHVEIPSEYIDSLFVTFFGRSPFADKSDIPSNGINPDQALITLKSPISEVQPVPYVSADEAKTIITEGETKISLVGFGQKADTRASVGTKGLIGFLKANLEKEGFTDQQVDQLKRNIELLTVELDRVSGLIEKSGDKNTADITVAKFEDFIVASNLEQAPEEVPTVEHDVEENSDAEKKPVVEVTREELEELLKENILQYATENDMTANKAKEFVGACFGDSGGPAFAKKADGTLVQVGVIVAVDFCGSESYITPIKF